MSEQIAVIYWSGTGNTQAMAEAVSNACGGTLYTPDAFPMEQLAECGAVALGCPAMGAEVLEESEFQPFFDAVKPLLSGKKLALFGSYGWGDGEWMRNWEEECRAAGAAMVCDPVICQDAPDADALAQCEALGRALKEA